MADYNEAAVAMSPLEGERQRVKAGIKQLEDRLNDVRRDIERHELIKREAMILERSIKSEIAGMHNALDDLSLESDMAEPEEAPREGEARIRNYR